MREAATTPLERWTAAWLTHQRSLGRGYDGEQWSSPLHLQRFMSPKYPTLLISTRSGLTAGAHPSYTCRRPRAAIVNWPSASFVCSADEQNRIASCQIRSTSLDCVLIGAP